MKSEILQEISKDVETCLSSLLGSKLKKIILYGSYARGDYDEESDIDFLALTEALDNESLFYEDKITNITVDLSLKYEKVISILLKNEDFFNRYIPVLPFYNNVVSEGKIIYG